MGVADVVTRGSRGAPVAGGVRRACDDASLSFPVRLCDAPYLLQLLSPSGVRKSAHASKILNVSRTEGHGKGKLIRIFFSVYFGGFRG